MITAKVNARGMDPYRARAHVNLLKCPFIPLPEDHEMNSWKLGTIFLSFLKETKCQGKDDR